MTRRAWTLFVTTSLALTAACSEIDYGEAGRQNVGDPPPEAPAAPPPGSTGCAKPELRGTANGLRRLTKQELTNTLSDLVGPEFVKDAEVQAQLGLLASDKIEVSVSELAPDPAERQPRAILAIAAIATRRIVDVPASATKVLGACAGAATTIDDACAKSVIDGFGLRAYRRPLTEAESASYLASFKDSGGGALGLKRIFVRFLANPALSYHFEAGTTDDGGQPPVEGARVRLTDYEIASRISYGTIGSMPDAALLEAARNGELRTLENVRAHVTRLMANDPRARLQIDDFFRVYMQIDPTRVPDPFAPQAAAQSIDTEGLKEEMIQEAQDYYRHVVYRQNGRFADLFTSVDVFPRSSRMAAILEAPIATGEAPTQTTARHAGLLLRPAFLDSSADRTAAMHRGAIVRTGFLCDRLGNPPEAAITERLATLGDLSAMGNREHLTLLTEPAGCMACHKQINPLGFAFEAYDQLGKWRSTENLFHDGALTGTKPLDTTVSGLNLEPGAPETATDAAGLQTAIAHTAKATLCFAKTAFELRHLRPATDADACILHDLATAARDAGTVMNLFVDNIAAEDIFWKGGNP